MKVLLIAVLAACFGVPALCAREAHRGQEHTFVGVGQNAELEALQQKIMSAEKKKDWPAMEKASSECIKLDPNNPAWHYNLADAQILQGQKDNAARNLSKSAELGFDTLDHLKQDQDFNSLHEEKIWAEIVQKVSQNQDKKIALGKAAETRMKIRKAFYGNKMDQTIAGCDAFLKEFPNDTEMLLYRASYYAKTRKTNEAFADLEKYLDSAKRGFEIEQLKKNNILPANFMKTPAYRAYLAKAEKKLSELNKQK